MFIIEALPFSKGLNKETLSYFSPKSIEPGSLIKVNLRNRSVPALVLQSRDAAEAKAEIRTAGFQLKKISNAAVSKPFLQKEFFDAVRDTADYFAATTGSILSHLIPNVVIENPKLLTNVKSKNPENLSEEKKAKNEISVMQSPDEERFSHYRLLIREEFARKKSVFICLSQNEDIKQMKEKLERGIESYVLAFHNDMNKKEIIKEWKRASQTEHPILIISTPRWLFLPREDLGTIVIENENANGWKVLSRPFFDLRFFTRVFAKKKNLRLIIGDSFLRTETLYEYKQGEASEFESVKWRLPLEVKTQIIDLREITKKHPSTQEGKEFKTLSPELLALIQDTIEHGSHIFLFASRKGISASTVCRDCGEIVKCNNCASPMVLYKTKNGNVFRCHHCGEVRDAAEACQNCHGWRLEAFGAGIDRIAEEIKKEIPGVSLFEIHKDVTESSAKAGETARNFYSTRGSVLLGTEMAFSYLNKKIPSSAIASFDSLFSIPDFRVREKIFRIILESISLARERFLLQTHNPKDPAVLFATSGNLAEFYKTEIEDRQSLNYPPFGVFIKITVRGTRNFTDKESIKLQAIFANYSPAVFASIHEKRGEQSAINAVIKLPKNKWPDSELLHLIKSLPPHFEIKVDPDNLL